MPRVLVALATYNEIENLPGLVDEIELTLPTADILVVDDNSPDGTGKWCDARSEKDARVKCLHRPEKQGLGSATRLAFFHALDHGYDVVVTLDADGSHDPGHLPDLIRAAEHTDVAIGSRYISGGAVEGWPIHRRIASRCVNQLSRMLLRLPVRDSSGAFRAYRSQKLSEVQWDRIQATGYSYLEELLWHLDRAGATFAEVPITFRERRAGQSKVSFGELLSKLAMLCRLSLGEK
jgi:dolichol-phosphate mannosyltransferase